MNAEQKKNEIASESKENILAILSFQESFIFCDELLGSKIEIDIKEMRGRVFFPLRPKETSEPQKLEPPALCKGWEIGEDPINWGNKRNLPKLAEVKKLLVEICDPVPTAEDFKKLYELLGEWIFLLESYLILLSKQHTNVRAHSKNIGNLEIFVSTPEDLRSIQRKMSVALTMSNPENTAIKAEQFNAAIDYCSKPQEPKLEYKILLDAYEAYRNRDFRKAVIESANSTEACLTSKIKMEFEKRSISFGDKLLKKYPMLGGRFELLDVLEIALSRERNFYTTNINKPRNDVMHGSAWPDAKTALKSIRATEELLADFSPLNGSLEKPAKD